jgi:hypothetical protein
VIRWAAVAPAKGHVFDVQLMRAGGPWKNFRIGSGDSFGGKVTRGKRVLWSVRARLRQANDRKRATDWSPVATIKG